MMTDEKAALHIQFWNNEKTKVPIVSYRFSEDSFFPLRYEASKRLLIPGKVIKPEDIVVEDFIEDYRMYMQWSEQVGQTGFYGIEPINSFPWIEAMCGCEIVATPSSFVSEPFMESPEEYEKIVLSNDNPWFIKYKEFMSKMWAAFDHKVPIGHPVTRTISDCMGAVLGQTEMVYAIYDYEDEMKELARRVCDVYLGIIDAGFEVTGPVEGGYIVGFYHLWAPGKIVWFQEDLASIITPDHYNEFVYPQHKRICDRYDYSLIHQHSASFHIIDGLLRLDGLDVIEINKDIGGMSIPEMIPIMQKIQKAGKKVLLWGDLTGEEIDLVKEKLEHRGLAFNIVTPTVETAKRLHQHLMEW